MSSVLLYEPGKIIPFRCVLTYFVDSGTYVETYSLVRFSYFLSLLLPFLFHCPGSSIIYFIIYVCVCIVWDRASLSSPTWPFSSQMANKSVFSHIPCWADVICACHLVMHLCPSDIVDARLWVIIIGQNPSLETNGPFKMTGTFCLYGSEAPPLYLLPWKI